MQIWEILVPYQTNSGLKYSMTHHKQWDAFVRKLTGGITILKLSKGEWVSPSGKLYTEKMIPCRIICTPEQIESVVDFTIEHYDQEAIAYYQITDNVILRHRK